MAGTAQVLTAEAILDATEGALRRHGPAKATVLDVARALGVSHGSVYRHFPSRTALRAAVVERWLERTHSGLAALAADTAPPPRRLHDWLRAVFASKRAAALEDPELFATYALLTAEQERVVIAHLDALVAQIERILVDGVASGDLAVADPGRTARAVFDATVCFHDPAYAASWGLDGIDDDFRAVVGLVLDGLRTR